MKYEILNAQDVDQQLLYALGKESYGPDTHEGYEHFASFFMFARICDLSKSEQYFCYMQNLLISSSKSGDHAYLKHYLKSFMGHVPNAVEQFLKDKHINLRGLSLAQLHAYIMETWQEHCLEKRVSKNFIRHQSMYILQDFVKTAKMLDWGCGVHNRGHLGKESSPTRQRNKNFIQVTQSISQISHISISKNIKRAFKGKRLILRKGLPL